jgi:hypothetical protein
MLSKDCKHYQNNYKVSLILSPNNYYGLFFSLQGNLKRRTLWNKFTGNQSRILLIDKGVVLNEVKNFHRYILKFYDNCPNPDKPETNNILASRKDAKTAKKNNKYLWDFS